KTPVLLLKTKSTPDDGYDEYFSAADDGRYGPVFVPVLEHRFKTDSLKQIRECVQEGGFDGNSKTAKYGAIIFTSQRAVEAFTQVVEDIRAAGPSRPLDELLPATTPLYVVGPATARGLRALNLQCPVLGEESGNGEALAGYILEHYNHTAKRDAEGRKLPILFLVGEQRRDVIPKTLQSAELSDARRAEVHELVVYETGEMQTFRPSFARILEKNERDGVREQWVVVFSPTGCRVMLECLGLLDGETGRAKEGEGSRKRDTRIATIGPTTRDFLVRKFGFEPDVCAPKPSPEGVGEAIEAFERTSSSPPRSQEEKISPNKGTKRKADTSASPKAARGKKAVEKKQKTLEETLPEGDDDDKSKDVEMNQAAGGEGAEVKKPDETEASKLEKEAQEDDEKKDEDSGEVKAAGKQEDGPKEEDAPKEVHDQADGAIEESSQRRNDMPSNILEKGIIYFFTRSRVGIDDPEGASDIQRSYFVLRPIPKGAKLGDGTIDELNNNRLFALPKKVLPKSPNDRFMAFVEKAQTTVKDLKESFFAGTGYQTQTAGSRQQHPVMPIGEGVYALTQTGRNTHLAYMLTVPSELGEVQEEMGLHTKGSFVMSVKNPERPGPANAQLDQKPDWPKEFINEFRGLAWSPVRPKYLDYAHVQILLIGEGNTDNSDNMGQALEPAKKDEKDDNKETPKEEMEKLEHEDELRVEHLKGDESDAVFADLGLDRGVYEKVVTTW
ncbi:tetrapyrrole biosynthesis, uroporphyrinogen III synthase, partial [Saccharata proteae CBS 121410]